MSNDIFSYTNRSLENARQEGMRKIPIISRGDWTDLNPTDPGMIILDYVHSLVDMINFYQDHQALETFISTAKERKNIFRLAKQLSYQIRSAKGATVDLEFSVKEHHADTIKIPRYTRVSTESGIPFITVADAYIYSNELSVSVPAVQGEIYTEEYRGTGISRFSNIPNAVDQRCTLSRYNIDIDSISIVDSLNRVWLPVVPIVFSTENDRVYQRELNPDGTITIQFGSGERGIIPESTDFLYITYLQTAAEEGRTGADTIVKMNDNIYDILGHPIDIYVTNPESTAGGSGPASDEEITEQAPGIIKSQGRAVTLRDFENLAKSVEGVADAKAYDINNAPDLCLYHEVKVLIVPELHTTVNNSLTKRVYDYLYYRMIPPTNLQVIAPSEITLDLSISYVKSSGIIEGGIEYSLREAVMKYFDNRYGAVGQSFNPNELIGHLNNIPGVRYIDRVSVVKLTPNPDIDKLVVPITETISIPMMSIIRLGELTITQA